MADILAHRLPAAIDRPRWSLADHLPQRASLWTGLVLGVAASVVPAAFVAQPARVALLKFGVAITFTILPGWLYVVYLDRRGESLYDEFVLNLFRLDIDDHANLPMPPRHTTYFQVWKAAHDGLWDEQEVDSVDRTTDNLYRRRFEGLYGHRAVSTRSAFDGGTTPSQVETFSPVLLATLLIGVGWTMTLQPELMFDLNVLTGVELSGQPAVPVAALQSAFMGAYAFVLQDLVRRYFVVDLRNTAYVAAISRIVLVTLIVAVLYADQSISSAAQLAVAFSLGFFPRAALEALQARTVRPLARRLQGRRNERLLGELEGMDIWQEARLVELGIENLQQFATADLVEVLLRSRTPADRLVYWLDHALLLLLLPAGRPDREGVMSELLQQGVRGATDLDHTFQHGSQRQRADVARALGMHPGGLSVAIASLRGQRNYRHVAAFRAEAASPATV
jgi:hypothetical protein